MTRKTKQSVEKAKDIIGDIFNLIGEHEGGADWELNNATDAMYKFIKTIEGK